MANAGKTVLVLLRDAASGVPLSDLLGVGSIACEEARPAEYAMLAGIHFEHPLFAPFAEPRFSDFTQIHFWKYRRLDPGAIPGAVVLAKFDNEDPALLEALVGQGRVLALTCGWHPDDSQLALSSKFVPLVYSLLDYAGAAAPAPAQYHIGDIVPLPKPQEGMRSELSVRLPDGTQTRLDNTQTNFQATALPGIYTITSATRTYKFAVNLDPAEGRTAPVPADELERLGVPVSFEVSGFAERRELEKQRLQNSEVENRQKLWRWVLAATMLVVLLETWLAARTTRRETEPRGTSQNNSGRAGQEESYA